MRQDGSPTGWGSKARSEPLGCPLQLATALSGCIRQALDVGMTGAAPLLPSGQGRRRLLASTHRTMPGRKGGQRAARFRHGLPKLSRHSRRIVRCRLASITGRIALGRSGTVLLVAVTLWCSLHCLCYSAKRRLGVGRTATQMIRWWRKAAAHAERWRVQWHCLCHLGIHLFILSTCVLFKNICVKKKGLR